MPKKKKPAFELHACIITKDSEKVIGDMLKSIEPHVDNIFVLDTGSTDGTIKVLEDFGCVVDKITPKENPGYYVEIEGKTYPKFAKIRNRSFEPVNKKNGDWILWIDSDDEFVTSVDVKKFLAEADKKGVTAIGADYEYTFFEDGRPDTVHSKQRFLKAGVYRWEYDDENWIIHENVYPFDGEEILEAYADVFKVKHTNSDQSSSAQRNIVMLKHMVELLPDDPRVWFLLGRDAWGALDGDTMLTAFQKALTMDLSDADRRFANLTMAKFWEVSGFYKTSLSFALDALAVGAFSADANTAVAKYMLLLGRHEEAIDFGLRAAKAEISMLTGENVRLYEVQKTLAYTLSTAYERLERYDMALKVLFDFRGSVAKGVDAEVLEQDIKDLRLKKQSKELDVVYAKAAAMHKHKGNDPLLADELLPDSMFPTKVQVELRRELGHYKKRGNKAIDFYCLNNFEEWDPETVVNKGGGGSETAVIELTKRWAAQGFNVTVWANPPVSGKRFEGVVWNNVKDFPYEDDFNILIGWRTLDFFVNYNLSAKKKYLYLQDIMQPFDYYKGAYEKVDKIIVLSKYHRETAPAVPENKFYYTTNGINLDLIKEAEAEAKAEGIERIPGYCINASSADRGLEGLVKMWPKIILEAPHASLAWYYGWNSWNAFRKDKAAEKFKKKMIKQMAKYGIKEGGRIGKKELYKEYLRAQIWAYPLVGPAETSCITAMEAQALGSIPITTGITALEETQQFGVKVPLNEYKDTLIASLNAKDNTEEYRQEMMRWAREHFNWDRIAQQWVDDLF